MHQTRVKQVAQQRKQYKLLQQNKESSITQERVNLLNELGFAWNAFESAWVRHMEDLRTFHRENGHCNVTKGDKKFPKLGRWVKEQRRHFSLMKQNMPSHLTEERIDELNSVGFCEYFHRTSFKLRLTELATFKLETGHCNVPMKFAGNKKLGPWVKQQRQQRKLFNAGRLCHITEERIRTLDKLGFVWCLGEKKRPLSENDDSSVSTSDGSSSGSEEDIKLEGSDVRPSQRQRCE